MATLARRNTAVTLNWGRKCFVNPQGVVHKSGDYGGDNFKVRQSHRGKAFFSMKVCFFPKCTKPPNRVCAFTSRVDGIQIGLEKQISGCIKNR